MKTIHTYRKCRMPFTHLYFTMCYRRPQGSSALPGGPDSRRSQFLCSISQSHPARSAHPDMSSVLSQAAVQSVRASVHHAQHPPTWCPPHSGRTHPAAPQVGITKRHTLPIGWLNHALNFSRVASVWFRSDPNVADNTKQGLNKILADEVPIEVKPVNPPDVYRRVPMEPKTLFWVRSKGHIGK